jgi:hypothetical protein
MTAKVSNVVSPKEVPIPSGTVLMSGAMYVNADTNGVIVAPSNLTAAALATLVGCSAVKTIDLPARVGAFPDTGRGIFD